MHHDYPRTLVCFFFHRRAFKIAHQIPNQPPPFFSPSFFFSLLSFFSARFNEIPIKAKTGQEVGRASCAQTRRGCRSQGRTMRYSVPSMPSKCGTLLLTEFQEFLELSPNFFTFSSHCWLVPVCSTWPWHACNGIWTICVCVHSAV